MSENKKRRTSHIFWMTFFVTLVVFMVFVKLFSPNVDVNIAEKTEEPESESKEFVDERLKAIQLDDKTAKPNLYTTENQENLVEREGKDYVDPEDSSFTSEDIIFQEHAKYVESQGDYSVVEDYRVQSSVPKPQPPKTQPAQQTSAKMLKILVGEYVNSQQAEACKNRLKLLNLPISPFVKEYNGFYTVQVGSFINQERAQQIVDKLESMNFYVKVIKE